MKHLLKPALYLLLTLIFSELNGQVLNTTNYRDTTVPRIEKNPSHYGFIYPIEKDFYDSVSYTPPLDGRFFVQNYGPRTLGNYDNHQGSDIWGHSYQNGVLTYNPPALCMCDGTIEKLTDGPDSTIDLTSAGRVLRILCDSFSQVFSSPIHIVYLHLDSISSALSLGDRVSKGDTIADVGKSGTTTLTHLHFDYYAIPNLWGNSTSRKWLNPMRLFDPAEHPHVVGKLDNVHMEILKDWSDSTLIRIHWPHNQHINRYEFTNGTYNIVYDVEEVRASYAVYEPSIWARDSMKIFPYRTNGYRSALYYQINYNYPAIFPNSPNRDTNLAMYGYPHIPLTADSVVNVYDFMLEGVPSGHNVNDWVVKVTDVWGYTVEGSLSSTDIEELNSSEVDFKIYPNPASDVISFEFEGGNEINFVSISTITGELMLTKKLKNSGDTIDVSQLSNGVYLITINGKTVKFIKN